MATAEIAHVVRKLELSAWGGTETYLAELCRRLGKRGFGARVLAPQAASQDDQEGSRRLGGAVIERYRALCPYVGTAQARAALRAAGGNLVPIDLTTRLLRSRSALAHLHTGRRVGGAAAVAMRLLGRPYVVSVHGPLLADAAVAEREAKRRAAGALDVGAPFGWLVGARRVVENAARVLIFNDAEHRALRERIGARAVRMDHGVDAEALGSGSRRRAQERWPALAGGPVVLALGRVCEQKNQALAVRALARGGPAGAKLVLAGAETDPGYGARVEAEARALGVADRLVRLGNVAPEQVPDLLAASDLVMTPSTHEAFGIVVVEAWAARRPVLFSATTGTRPLAEALGVAEACVPTLEDEAWGQALGRWLSDEGLRRRAVEAGERLVAERFGWERVAGALAELYREVLSDNRRAA